MDEERTRSHERFPTARLISSKHLPSSCSSSTLLTNHLDALTKAAIDDCSFGNASAEAHHASAGQCPSTPVKVMSSGNESMTNIADKPPQDYESSCAMKIVPYIKSGGSIGERRRIFDSIFGRRCWICSTLASLLILVVEFWQAALGVGLATRTLCCVTEESTHPTDLANEQQTRGRQRRQW